VNTQPTNLSDWDLKRLVCQQLVEQDWPDMDVCLAARYGQPWIAAYVNEVREQLMASR